LAIVFVELRVSRGSAKGRTSSGKPQAIARACSNSAFTSAPSSRATLVNHNRTKKTTTPAKEPYVFS
jgi:hypothetical protein